MAQRERDIDVDDHFMWVNIGVILSKETFLGKMGMSCIKMALSDLYDANPNFKTRLALHFRDSKNDVITAASAAEELIRSVKVKAIIGPETSVEAPFVIQLGGSSQVPIISYSASSPSLTSIGNPYFIQATQSDTTLVQAITAVMKEYSWGQAVPIYVDNEFGSGLLPYLADALQQNGIGMPHRGIISPSASDEKIESELYRLMTKQPRVFIVHMNASLGSRLFLKAKQIGMLSKGYVWIITNGMADYLNSDVDLGVVESMQGVLGVRTYVNVTKDYVNFVVRWKKKFQEDNPGVRNPQIDVSGIWAYDAASALARGIEKAVDWGANFTFSTNSTSSSDPFSLGASEGGPQLREAIISSKFRGISGDYNLAGGKLQSSVYELINMVGKENRVFGNWTEYKGLALETTNTTRTYNLGNITFPGNCTSIPKGWVISTNEKKLQIGVPVKKGFLEFVKVAYNNDTNTAQVSGFCIDLFDAVMSSLPYSVQYEYIPFALPNRSSAGDYNDLVYQVYLQKYDAVVGDITIVYNRSQYVDFTLPYTESGVAMVVPKRNDKDQKDPWVFLKPLSKGLWATTLSFFIFVGFVIWVLEHRINPDFRGSREHQAGTTFYYAFSTMVFAHTQQVFSNLGRLVVIVWVFVILILTQSYTASLTSYLAVVKLVPVHRKIEELQTTNASVGYQDDSFVEGLLREMNITNLRPYGSLSELLEMMSNESGKGGIVAAFDETAFASAFTDIYCKNYSMIPLTNGSYRTGGFGFAFPKGSPLVSDVSRAILAVIEGNTMTGIQKKWFPYEGSCPADSPTLIDSSNLRLESFWGLFIIAGGVATFALIVSVTKFLYDQRDVLRGDPDTSICARFRELLRIFDQRDLQSHTFRINQQPDAGSTTPNTPSEDQHRSPDYPNSGGLTSELGHQLPHPNLNAAQAEGVAAPNQGYSPTDNLHQQRLAAA